MPTMLGERRTPPHLASMWPIRPPTWAAASLATERTAREVQPRAQLPLSYWTTVPSPEPYTSVSVLSFARGLQASFSTALPAAPLLAQCQKTLCSHDDTCRKGSDLGSQRRHTTIKQMHGQTPQELCPCHRACCLSKLQVFSCQNDNGWVSRCTESKQSLRSPKTLPALWTEDYSFASRLSTLQNFGQPAML